MSAVDFCPPDAASQAPSAAPGASDSACAACGEAFASAAELRAHCKSERHVYNTKRRLAGLRPIPLEAWERKLKESRGTGGQNKGTAHLKAGKAPRARPNNESPVDAETSGKEAPPEETPKDAEATPKEAPFSPRGSLFDKKHFETLDENLKYMWRNYGFSIPDQEYCMDVSRLLEFLWRKINEPPHACIFCNRRFPDAGSVRRHMLDKSHSRIGTEARTRRGHTDELGSKELQAELEEFYDYTASTREVTEKITDPKIKVAALLRFFDKNRDDRLDRRELSALWQATTGGELAEALYEAACARAGARPDQGLDAEALFRLYGEGLADLEGHWSVLQDILAQRLSSKRSAAGGRQLGKLDDVEEEDEDDDEDGEDDDEGDEEEEEEEDGSDSDSDETEILECDDEEEFEEVMRILGLQPATLLDNGDLRLPNGTVAAHRDVAYIWKQRGTRVSALAVLGGGGTQRPGARTQRAQLMISNRNDGCVGIALTRRAQAREGKRIVAVLRHKQHAEMRLGLQQNILQKRKPAKFKTIFGDASGGH